jgi:CheY-like chemotaxis protein
MGVAVPIVLHALSQSQLHREELRARALADAVREASSDSGLEAALAPLGPNTYGFVVRRSNNLIIAGRGGRYMRRNGWEVDEAEDGEAALGMLHATPPAGYDLVITDLRMPVLSGFEVHDWLAEHRPDLFARLVIATGDVASQPVREFLNRTSRPVLEKPFELSALAELVARVRGGPS